jgi:hypothetical protein
MRKEKGNGIVFVIIAAADFLTDWTGAVNARFKYC